MEQVFPGAIVQPGKYSNYQRGRTKNQCVKIHFTVGLGDGTGTLIKNNGLAQFYIRKDGRVFQYAPADSQCIDSCEWNDEGPGIEFERHDWADKLTPQQIESGGNVIGWLHATFGYPIDKFYWGLFGRLKVGDPFKGYVNHGALHEQACDEHTDGCTLGEFNSMVQHAASAPAPGVNPNAADFVAAIKKIQQQRFVQAIQFLVWLRAIKVKQWLQTVAWEKAFGKGKG